MSDYEYDTGATRLVISEGLDVRDDKHFVVVSAEHLNDVNVAVAVQDEDAPAVALAILDAAGVGSITTPTPAALNAAHSNLRRHVEKQRRDAEREAEDAKVRSYFEKTHGWPAGKPGDKVSDCDREIYLAAREFFREFFKEEQ